MVYILKLSFSLFRMRFLAQADNKYHITKLYFDKYTLMTSEYLNYLSFLEVSNQLFRQTFNQRINYWNKKKK